MADLVDRTRSDPRRNKRLRPLVGEVERLRRAVALCAAPGSTTASVAEATGISSSTVGATISRLVKQERVQRLQEGGYAPADPAATGATGDTPSAQAPATTPAG